MIYLVSLQQRLYPDEITLISVDKSLELLKSLNIVGLDTETRGMDPYTKELLSVQLGCNDFQVVVDCTSVDIRLYKDYLESERLFIGWNLKFDLRFLYHKGIYPKKVYDGYLAEKLMWLGYPAGIHSMSLKTAGMQYLGIELDKSVRGKIQYAGLTDEVIVYAAYDVKYLDDIRLKQLELLNEKGLVKANIDRIQEPTIDPELDIIGPTFIKPKVEYEYFVEADVRGNWFLDGPKVPVTLERFKTERGTPGVKVKWNSSQSGQFTLWYGGADGHYKNFSKTIVVESLF